MRSRLASYLQIEERELVMEDAATTSYGEAGIASLALKIS